MPSLRVLEFLNENHIKALILDVDNTLIDYYKNLSKEIVVWTKDLKDKGIVLYILSNTNKKEKVKTVANKLGIPYEMFAQKPFKKGFIKVQKEIQINPENIGVVGDQIFTDVIGANSSKMHSILVEPLAEKDLWMTRFKRPIEELVIKKYLKKIGG